MGVEVQLRSGHEVLVAADARDLPAVDGVGHHLAVEIDREGTVDRHEVGVPGDDRGVVDRVDRQEGHLFVPVQPSVELGDAEGEGRHRHTLEQPLGVVGDLAGLVQLHQAGGEHLGVDAEPTERPAGELRGHDVGDGADAGLQRRPVPHVGQRVGGDGLVNGVGRGVGEGEWGAIGLDEHIDRVQRDGVVVRGRQAPGAGQVRVDLHDEEPLGVPPGAEELVPRAPHVQGEVDAPPFGRCRLRHHHAGSEPGHDRPHLPETARHQLHPVPLGVVDPLRRSEEPAAVAHPGLGEDLVEVQAQRTSDLQVLPVVAGSECGEQCIGDTRPEAETDPIDRSDQRDGLLDRADVRHGSTLAPGHVADHVLRSWWRHGSRRSMTFGSTHNRGAPAQ